MIKQVIIKVEPLLLPKYGYTNAIDNDGNQLYYIYDDDDGNQLYYIYDDDDGNQLYYIYDDNNIIVAIGTLYRARLIQLEYNIEYLTALTYNL
jgi:hypothetical protein